MSAETDEKIALHRCPLVFLRGQWHGCNAVQSALEERGIAYELKTAPLRKARRTEVLEASGQAVVPTIIFADGTAYRDEGKVMAAEIREGRLFDQKG